VRSEVVESARVVDRAESDPAAGEGGVAGLSSERAVEAHDDEAAGFLDLDLAKTGMADAVRYARGQWSKLREVFEHGEARIDNNLAEQAIRLTKLGMKNWLFVGSPNAGKTAAMVYTILECCRRHGVEPTAYLKDALEKLPNMMANEAEQLTPSNWKKSKVNTR